MDNMDNGLMEEMETETEETETPETETEEIAEYDYDVDGNDILTALAIGVASGLATLAGAKLISWAAPKAKQFGCWVKNKFRKPGDPIEVVGTVVEEEPKEPEEKSKPKK